MYLNMTRKQMQATQARSRCNLLLYSSKYAQAFFPHWSLSFVKNTEVWQLPSPGKAARNSFNITSSSFLVVIHLFQEIKDIQD